MFRMFKQRWGPKICSLIPHDLWHRLLEVELVLPYYHVVSEQDLPHVSGLYKLRKLQQFEDDLDFFLRFYKPVNLQDIIDHLDGVRRLPKRCFLLTFDDGFHEIYDVIAPLLYKKGIPAVFFLITSVIDNRDLCYPQKKSLLLRALTSLEDSFEKQEVLRHLTRSGINGPDLPTRIRSIYYRDRHVLDDLGKLLGCDFADYVASVQPYLSSVQVKALMKKGFAIGAHSIDHPLYSELTLEEQLFQTRESINYLSKQFHYNCKAFAFPYMDAGISHEFYKSVFTDSGLKVTFGTGGILPHFFPRNLSRFSMERTDLPAAQILARQFGKAFLYRPLRGKART